MVIKRRKKSAKFAKDSKHNNLPKDEHGNVIKKGGRKKGVVNHVTREAKEMIALAFEGMGGLPAFIEWGKKHPTPFYTIVYTKLTPLQVVGKLDHAVHSSDASAETEALKRAFLSVMQSRVAPPIIDVTPESNNIHEAEIIPILIDKK